MNGEGVRIAIIERGCNSNHAAFRSKSEDYFYLHNLSPNATEDDINHGTAVCGIVAGEVITIPGAGNRPPSTVCGVAPRAKVTVVGCLGSLKSLHEAMKYIRNSQKPFDVVSISHGSHCRLEASMREEIEQFISFMKTTHRTIFLAASGNIGNKGKMPFPASLSNVISIGSLDVTSAKHANEARDDGVGVYCYGDNLVAPWGSNSTLSEVTGSSMATPVAAGLTALAIQCAKHHSNYRLTQEKVEDMLKYEMRGRGKQYDMKPAEFLLGAIKDVSCLKKLNPADL